MTYNLCYRIEARMRFHFSFSVEAIFSVSLPPARVLSADEFKTVQYTRSSHIPLASDKFWEKICLFSIYTDFPHFIESETQIFQPEICF